MIKLESIVKTSLTENSNIQLHNIWDSYANKYRTCWIYLPKNIDSLKKYPVIYMHDGQNLFFDNLAFGKKSWGMQDSLSKLSKQNLDLIVVGIENTPHRMKEYLPFDDEVILNLDDSYYSEPIFQRLSDNLCKMMLCSTVDKLHNKASDFPSNIVSYSDVLNIFEKTYNVSVSEIFPAGLQIDDYLDIAYTLFSSKKFVDFSSDLTSQILKKRENHKIPFECCGNKYVDFIKNDLKKYIDSMYNTEDSAIAGSSLGGIISLYAVMKYPETFSKAFSFSTSSGPYIAYLQKIISKQKTIDNNVVYMDIGRYETFPSTITKSYMNHIGMSQSEETSKLILEKNPRKFMFGIDLLGTHDEQSWGKRIGPALMWAYKNKPIEHSELLKVRAPSEN